MKNDRFRYCGYRFPPEIISYAVWAYHFSLSFRDVEDLLAERGIIVSYETIRQWCQKFGPEYARKLKRREGRLGDHWHLDEVFIRINGQQQYLWRAVDVAASAMRGIGKFMKVYSRFIRSNEMAHSFEGSLESIAVLVSFGALLLALFNRNHF